MATRGGMVRAVFRNRWFGSVSVLRAQSPGFPHPRVEGRTFEFSFPLPGNAQAKKKRSRAADPGKNTGSKARKNHREGSAGTTRCPQELNGNSTSQEAPSDDAEDQRKKFRKYDRARSQTPERMEYRRLLAQERRQKAKELGKCKSCSNPAKPGQTRCPTCAEKHRESKQRSGTNQRTPAKQVAINEK